MLGTRFPTSVDSIAAIAMSSIFERLEQAIDAMASLEEYPHTDRRDTWLERLRLNLPELEAFDRLPPAPETGFLTQPPADIAPGGVAPGADADGIAAIARAARAAPDKAGEAPFAALASAHAQAGLKAFISLADPATIEAAVAAAVRGLREGARMPLLGVPFAVKDLMAVAGLPQSDGTGGAPTPPAHADALAVARLRAAGAVPIGMANLHELAYGITSENPHHGHVGNPRKVGHIAGGSSGGSAAAVAAGIVRFAIGTDTGGSIRIPAACCGVVGFKPSFDAVPRDGVSALGASLDHVGPIAASVADAALAYAIMAGQPAHVAQPRPLAGLRVGVPRAACLEPLAGDVAGAIGAALEFMRRDGAEPVELDLPGLDASAALQFVTLCSEATELHRKRLVERPETLGPDVRKRLEMGLFLPATWYVRAQRGRAALAAMFATAMRDVDLIVMPTLRTEAPPSGVAMVRLTDREIPAHTAMTAFTTPFNLTGMPALTLPCGQGHQGLPIGIQLVGRRGDDWRVLDVGARLEALLAASA